jgi:uncharacterized protein YktB (UPF0637 family)
MFVFRAFQWRKNAVNEFAKSLVGCSEHTKSLIVSAMLQDNLTEDKFKILRTRLEHVKKLLRSELKVRFSL